MMLRSGKRKHDGTSYFDTMAWKRAEVYGVQIFDDWRKELPQNGCKPLKLSPGVTFVFTPLKLATSLPALRDASPPVIVTPNGITLHKVFRQVPVNELKKGVWTRISEWEWENNADGEIREYHGEMQKWLVPRSELAEEYSVHIFAKHLSTWPVALVGIVHEYLYARDPEELFLNTGLF